MKLQKIFLMLLVSLGIRFDALAQEDKCYRFEPKEIPSNSKIIFPGGEAVQTDCLIIGISRGLLEDCYIWKRKSESLIQINEVLNDSISDYQRKLNELEKENLALKSRQPQLWQPIAIGVGSGLVTALVVLLVGIYAR